MRFLKLFRKDPKDLFLEFNPLGSYWRVVTWNFDLDPKSRRKWSVEVFGHKDFNIQWILNKKVELRFYQNKKSSLKLKVPLSNIELKDLMNLSIHSTLKYSIEKNYEFMLRPVTGATAMDFQAETRALQWIQASFSTLSRALENVKNQTDLILTGAFFSGQTPDTKEDVLRIVVFNLDIFYYMRPDNTLQIIVFDDKDKGHGKTKSPAFHQIIKVTKPQFYDEITKLILLIARVGEIV